MHSMMQRSPILCKKESISSTKLESMFFKYMKILTHGRAILWLVKVKEKKMA